MSERRWEPPLAKPLYVTSNRAAELLDVPYWKIWGLSFSLERRFFGEKGGAPRILLASIEEFIELRDAGEDAGEIMRRRRGFNGVTLYPPRAAVAHVYEDPRARRFKRNSWS